MINIFNEIKCNVLNNDIPHEIMICDDQDPPWIKHKVEKGLQEKHYLSSRVKSNINNATLLKNPQRLQNKLNDLSVTAKRKYYTSISMNVMDPTTGLKPYWSILKDV